MAALYKEQLGEQIKRRRKALGLTQSELADKAHVKESQTVSRWERGERAPNDLENVAGALETTAAEMLAELAPINQSDRKRLQPGGGSQLDRLEAMLAEALELLRGIAPQAPAGALAHDLATGPPSPRKQRRTERQRAADGPAGRS